VVEWRVFEYNAEIIIEMNYQRIYDAIVLKSRSENRKILIKDDPNYIYYEDHHIIPKCMNGTDEKENKVLLTAREHYIMHKLLTLIYPNNRSLDYALHRMMYSKKKDRNLTFSSRDYAYLRELMKIDNSGEKNPMFRTKHSPESNKKRGEAQMGEKNHMWGKNVQKNLEKNKVNHEKAKLKKS
jgi:hypothetical protein